ncbi:unnamed protein product, partial [Iphiclides podalirius]
MEELPKKRKYIPESQLETQCDTDYEFVEQAYLEQNSQTYDDWEPGQENEDEINSAAEAEIISTQNRLEENITKKFNDLQAQISNAGSSKDTVSKVAEELRRFREIIFGILGLLRQQIRECSKQELTCSQIDSGCLHNKLGLSDISKSALKVCHSSDYPVNNIIDLF